MPPLPGGKTPPGTVGLTAAEIERLVIGVDPTSFQAIVAVLSWLAATVLMSEYDGELARAFVRVSTPDPVTLVGHVLAGGMSLSKSTHW
jgi:hypothetical protein